MAVMRVTFRSTNLRTVTDVNIIYPLKKDSFGDPEGRTPQYDLDDNKKCVLWLIHGGGDNYSDWVNRTRISELAEAKNLVVVMPSIRDFTSSRSDTVYYGYLSEVLPAFIRHILPVSEAREDNFIAGLSMGGYISYRTALNNPEKYSCVGSLSSPLDIVADYKARHAESKTLARADSLIGTDKDIYALVEKNLKEKKQIPRMFQACGTEDFTWEINVSMRDFFRSKGLDLTWEEGPGMHCWYFWSIYIEKLLNWLPLSSSEEMHKFQKGES